MPTLPGISYDILVRTVGMEATAAKIAKDAEVAGTRAGTGFNNAFSRSVASAAQTQRAMAVEVQTASKVLETSSARVVAAKDAELQKIGQVRIAESKLSADRLRFSEMSASGSGASAAKIEAANARVVRSEELVATAMRGRVAASTAVTAAAANETRAADAHAAAQTRSAATTGTAAAAIGTAAKVGLGAFVIGSAAAVHAAGDFQQSQARLVASAGETEHGVQTVSKGILKLAGDVGYSAKELSSGMYTVESAGYHGADALKVMRAAAQGAWQENADLHEVNDGLTTSMHDFGYSADKASVVMSKMVVAVGNSKSNFQEFSASLHSVEPAAAGAGIKLEDVYGVLAKMTQTGMSAAQATENMRNAINSLSNPTSQMRDEMAKFGLNADDVKNKLGERGLAGSMQVVDQAIRSHMNPAQQLVIDTMYKNKQVTEDSIKMFNALPPAARNVAQAIKDNTISYKEFRKTGGGLTVEQRNQVDQWLALQKKITGYSTNLKQGRSTIETYNQAMKTATGTVAGQSVALSVVGDHAKSTNELIGQIGKQSSGAGGDVKGFDEILGTFNFKLAQFKSGLGAAGIAIGTVLLPAATKFLGWLTDASHFLMEHQTLLKGLIVVVGSLVGAWATVRVGTAIFKGLAGTIGGARSAIRFFIGDAMRANVFSRMASGAKTAWTGIRVGAINAADATKAAWARTGDARAWTALRAEAVKNFVATKVSAGVEAGKSAAAWVAQGARSAGAWAAMKAKAVGSFVATSASAVRESVRTGTTWAVQNARAAGSFVGVKIAQLASAAATRTMTIAQRALNLAMKANPIGLIITGITLLVGGLIYAYKHFTWFRNGVNAVWKFIWNDVIKPVAGFIKREIEGLSKTWHWLYDHAIKPVGDAIGSAWHWLYDNVIKPVVDLIKKDIRGWGEIFSWLHDHVIKPVSDKIGSVLSGVRDAFGNTVKWIGDQWSKIKEFVAAPARFVIDTVYDKGVVPLWNGIASVFSLGKINPVHFAGGGTFTGTGQVPGYAPGKDSVPAHLKPGWGVMVPEAAKALGAGTLSALGRGRSGGGGAANSVLSPGERVLDDKQVAAVGGPQRLWAINHYFSGGRANANGAIPGVHFDVGGIFSGIGHVVGSAVHSVKDLVGDVASWVGDPVGKLKGLFKPWIEKATGAPDGGAPGNQWRKAITSVPSKMVGGAIDMIKSWFASHKDSIDAGNTPWNTGGGAAQWRNLAIQALTMTGFDPSPGNVAAMLSQINTESGGNPNIVQQVQDVNSGGNEGVGLLQVIPGTFAANRDPSLPNDRTNPLANMVAALRYFRGRYGTDLQGVWGHGHGYSGGGVSGLSLRDVIHFDGGGVMPGGAATAPSGGPINAINALKAHQGTPYAWGGGSWGGLDCSGVTGFGVKLTTGDLNPSGRIGNTDSLMAGQWPGMIRGASPNDILIAGVNSEHMAFSILGTNFEERTTGETMRIGANAVSPFDKQFTEQWHLDPNLIRPAYVPGGAAPDPVDTGVSSPTPPDAPSSTEVQDKITQATDAMNKDLADVKAAQASVASDLASAKRSDEMAKAAKTAALRVKYSAEAAKYRANADQQRASATKAQHDADTEKAKIEDLKKQLSGGDISTSSDVSGAASSTGSDSSSGLTFHDFGEKMGGIAADALSQTFSIGGIGPDLVTSSPLFKIGAAFAGAKHGKPYTPSILTNPNVKKVKPELHDEPAYLPDGISVISKVTKRPELNLGPDGTAKLHALLDGKSLGGGGNSGPSVVIEHQTVTNGDGHKVGREIDREMKAYSLKRRR